MGSIGVMQENGEGSVINPSTLRAINRKFEDINSLDDAEELADELRKKRNQYEFNSPEWKEYDALFEQAQAEIFEIKKYGI